jgi:hypothetical protein
LVYLLDDESVFYSLDVTDKANITVTDTYAVGGNANAMDISEDGDFIFLATSIAGSELMILNITDPYNITLETEQDLPDKAFDVSIDGDNIFIADKDNNFELIWSGEGGDDTGEGGSYYEGGDYTSPVFDTGSDSAYYNYLFWQAIVPAGTILQFHTRTSATADMNGASWVGPDGTASTYYESPADIIAVDPAATGTRYFQYRAYLYSDTNRDLTPVIEKVIVNYNIR